jgi:hypothetical protein
MTTTNITSSILIKVVNVTRHQKGKEAFILRRSAMMIIKQPAFSVRTAPKPLKQNYISGLNHTVKAIILFIQNKAPNSSMVLWILQAK